MNKEEFRDRIRALKTQNFLDNMDKYYSQSGSIFSHVASFDIYRDSENVAMFASKISAFEVFTDGIINFTLHNKKNVFLPRCLNEPRDLEFVMISNLVYDTEIASFSLREPRKSLSAESHESLARQLDLIFVPGMAFDTEGNRLGFGSGYYDSFLGKMRENKPDLPVVGLSFDFQIFDEPIPHNGHDVRMDYIISPNGLTEIHKN